VTKLTFSKETKSESSETKIPSSYESIERGRTRSRRFNPNVDQVNPANPVKQVNPDYNTVKQVIPDYIPVKQVNLDYNIVKQVNPDYITVKQVNTDYNTVKPVNPVIETKVPVSVSYKVKIVRQDEVPSPTRYSNSKHPTQITEFTHPVSACVIHIALRFFITYLD